MIAEVLNDDFLLSAAEDTRLELKGVVEGRKRRESRDEGPLDGISSQEIQEVIDELNRAYDEFDQERERKSAWMCMPRSPILAILQTELTRVALEQKPEAFVEEPDDVAERRIADDRARVSDDGRRAFGKFEITRPKILSDPRWLWSGVVIAWHKFNKKAQFGGLPEQPLAIADDARIVLVGDWGSGLKRAQDVGNQIRATLNEGLAKRRDQHVIHLGDVYYTGSKGEYEENFLPYWPVKPGEDIGSFTVCGNHDMYRGGHEYYGTALADPRFDRQAGKSVFALRNSNWQVLGLDTAYEDKRLSNGQVEWIERQLDSAPDVRTMLLSHHQLWSAYEPAGELLRPDVDHILAAGRVDAWFWGHEHRCLVYEPRDGVKLTSCVGHGGVPEYLIASEGEPYPDGLRYDYRKRHGESIEPWNTFGFVVIDLAGRDMRVRYIDETGTEHHTEDLPA